ncbi:hypothetical protein [Microbacterium sp. KR10-403]|uniref:hypothetical protein n=1 Tax=Microbacterium sp. KR10-403 TaxID=3158581 RepID=UPI0032E44C74
MSSLQNITREQVDEAYAEYEHEHEKLAHQVDSCERYGILGGSVLRDALERWRAARERWLALSRAWSAEREAAQAARLEAVSA